MQKVKRGDPLVIPAATFNAFVDAARDFEDRQRGTAAKPRAELRPFGLVPVRNESGADRQRFDVLGVAGPILTPTDNPEAFKSRVLLRGVVPQAGHAGRFVVLSEPVAAGAIGRAFVDGVCPVRVEMIDEAHGFADAAAGETDTLRSADSGTAQLLWVQPVEQRDDPAIAWTVARIGGGGAAGSASATLEYCQIESSIGTSPPFIYTARRVTPDGSGGFAPPYGDDFDLYNLAEIGTGGTGVHAVPDGSIVAFWQDPDSGEYFFDRSFYRGTY